MLHVSRSEYESLVPHEYAGTGTPLKPDDPGHWIMRYGERGTELVTGLAVLDDHDSQILADRVQGFDALKGPREGDYVRFADGVERRISHIWRYEDDPVVQTSKGGSWYLGNGYTSFSGSLYMGVPASTLTLTQQTKRGRVWFFHHDYAQAHNGVDVEIDFRVYKCSEQATS